MKQLKKLSNGWKQATLKQLITKDIKNGYSPNCPEAANGHWILSLGNLTENGFDISQVKPAPLEDTKVKDFLIETGDFLISRSNTLDKVGRVILFRGEIKNCSYPDLLMRFRIDEKDVWKEYLEVYLRSSAVRKHIQSCASGTSKSMVKINKTVVEKIPLVLPPYSEQKAIADILFTWDEAIDKTEQLIQAKKRLKAGRVQALITSKETNSTMGAFAKPIVRKVDKPSESYVALGIRSHFKGTFQRAIEDPNTISMTELYQVQEDDLIVNITFAWEGAIALVRKDDEMCYVSHRFPTYGILKEKADPSFVRQLIISSRMKYDLLSMSPGGAGRNKVLNKKDFLKMSIWLPDLKTQKQIGDLLGFIDNEIDFLKQLAEKYKTQKCGLMQKLLTGKWRVKPEILNQYTEV